MKPKNLETFGKNGKLTEKSLCAINIHIFFMEPQAVFL